MALIRFAEGQQRSGGVGGSVYSRNRFGAYIRARSIPVNPNTSRQQAVRAILRQLVGAWAQSLTAADRGQWNAYAAVIPWLNKLGEQVFLSGVSHYLRGNAARLQAAMTRVDTGPLVLALPENASVFTPSGVASTQIISVAYANTDAWAHETGGALLIRMGHAVNPTRDYYGGPWRYGTKVLGNTSTPPTSPATFTAPFTFGVGQRVYLSYAVCRADGRVSVAAQIPFLST